MRSIRGPFVLTMLQFLTAGAVVVVVGAFVRPDTFQRRTLLVLSVALGVLVVTHLYRRSRDDTWPAVRHGDSVDDALGIDADPRPFPPELGVPGDEADDGPEGGSDGTGGSEPGGSTDTPKAGERQPDP